MIYTWDEVKRAANLAKHHLDFADADMVLESPYAWMLSSPRYGESRQQAFAYVFDLLAVLSVVFAPDGEHCRIVSFRPANRKEREKYYAWLEENDRHDQ